MLKNIEFFPKIPILCHGRLSSVYHVVSLPAARHAGSWFQLPLKVQLKYFGAVLETQTYLPMHSGSNRALQMHRQLERVRFLPSSLLRQKIITAFLQGLYFDACLIPFRQLNKVTTAVVQAWWGPTRHLHNYMRSVAVTLGVLGPLHVLSPIVFMCYYTVFLLWPGFARNAPCWLTTSGTDGTFHGRNLLASLAKFIVASKPLGASGLNLTRSSLLILSPSLWLLLWLLVIKELLVSISCVMVSVCGGGIITVQNFPS